MNGAAVATAGTVVGSTLLRVWQDDKLDRPTVSFKAITAGFLLGAAISAVAMVDAGFANGLAILICVSSVLLNLSAVQSALVAITGKEIPS